jgi:hypothetical protein
MGRARERGSWPSGRVCSGVFMQSLCIDLELKPTSTFSPRLHQFSSNPEDRPERWCAWCWAASGNLPPRTAQGRLRCCHPRSRPRSLARGLHGAHMLLRFGAHAFSGAHEHWATRPTRWTLDRTLVDRGHLPRRETAPMRRGPAVLETQKPGTCRVRVAVAPGRDLAVVPAGVGHPPVVAHTCRYRRETTPSFTDALAALRTCLWHQRITSVCSTGPLPPKIRDQLIVVRAQAA